MSHLVTVTQQVKFVAFKFSIERGAFTNVKYMKTPQKKKTISNLRMEKYKMERKIKRLQCKAETMSKDGCRDITINEDMQEMANDVEKAINNLDLPKNDFRQIFWEQQVYNYLPLICMHADSCMYPEKCIIFI